MVSVIASQKILEIARAEDPKQWFIDNIDTSKFRTFGENLTVATFIFPEKTKGGIYRPKSNIEEDALQGNVGLVVAVGEDLQGGSELLHQWVRFSYNAGMKWRFREVDLRDIPIGQIRGTVENPDEVL